MEGRFPITIFFALYCGQSGDAPHESARAMCVGILQNYVAICEPEDPAFDRMYDSLIRPAARAKCKRRRCVAGDVHSDYRKIAGCQHKNVRTATQRSRHGSVRVGSGTVLNHNRLCTNALPDADLKQRSNATALCAFENAIYVLISHGFHFELCGPCPELCRGNRAGRSRVRPT